MDMGIRFQKVMTDKIDVSDLGKMFDMAFPDVDRVEIIDSQGRSYVNIDVKECGLMLQDNNKTLKLFLK